MGLFNEFDPVKVTYGSGVDIRQPENWRVKMLVMMPEMWMRILRQVLFPEPAASHRFRLTIRDLPDPDNLVALFFNALDNPFRIGLILYHPSFPVLPHGMKANILDDAMWELVPIGESSDAPTIVS